MRDFYHLWLGPGVLTWILVWLSVSYFQFCEFLILPCLYGDVRGDVQYDDLSDDDVHHDDHDDDDDAQVVYLQEEDWRKPTPPTITPIPTNPEN